MLEQILKLPNVKVKEHQTLDQEICILANGRLITYTLYDNFPNLKRMY